MYFHTHLLTVALERTLTD
ncbi:uncharacterized protein CPUR_08805 [Claviceps purpurea 20.1]|uniref:Uncharacterized protein n=1 Tax=Claviceps purpurea (strain 20.1) TaxID=1111077 RepID=M1W6U0_CLAP2|nr:uncharacterized protein CPUR_08805 [Claviceps purpurea 20.1]